MSIASEITRINDNIAAAYSSAEAKGATMPATENSDNLPACVGSIPIPEDYAGSYAVTENGTIPISGKKATQDITVNVAGSGGTIIEKTITANGTYNAADESADGYNPISVNVPTGYVRIDGAPDIDTIAANATDIVKGSVTYKPLYVIALMDTIASKTLTKTGTGVSTGADAYVFSDEPTTLYVGTSVAHTFNTANDFATSETWKARYVIMYATAANKAAAAGITVNLFNYRATYEFVACANTIFSGTSTIFGYTADSNTNLKYVDLASAQTYNNTISVNNFMSYCAGLLECHLPTTLTTISGLYAFQTCSTLAVFTAPALVTISGASCCAYCYSLKEFDAPLLITLTGNSSFRNNYSLKKFNAPLLATISGSDILRTCYSLRKISLTEISTFTTPTVYSLDYIIFIELSADFDIGGVNLTGATGYTKSLEWLNNELPTKLKDNSGGTAKTMTLGAANIALIGSEAATIIAAKNWTIA